MSKSPAGMSGKGSEAMHRSMMNGMQKMNAMKPSGDTDKDFAMIVGGDPNLLFFGQREQASSSPSVFFRSASLTRLLRG